MLIPSSTISHGNVPIQDGESRVSFTQYCAGGLLHWAQHGFQPAKKLSLESLSKINGLGSSRWVKMLGLFSTLDTLAADQRSVFGFD